MAKLSGVSYSSINTMINKCHVPTINTLIKICKGLNITLNQFFIDMEEITDEQSELLFIWNMLDEYSKDSVMLYMKGLAKKRIIK